MAVRCLHQKINWKWWRTLSRKREYVIGGLMRAAQLCFQPWPRERAEIRFSGRPREENYAAGGAREMFKGREGPEMRITSAGSGADPMDVGVETRLITICGAAV